MVSDEQFDDLLLQLEKLSADAPQSAVSDIVLRDALLATEVQRDPAVLDRLKTGLRTLQTADRRLGLGVEDDPVPNIPGFKNLREIGRGGMGIVYRAYQPSLHRTVAIKLMLAGRLGGPALRARFRVETEAVARLKHPNIIEVYEVGEADSVPFACFEYLDGGSLSVHIARHPLSGRDAARVTKTLAQAMEYAHRQGIIHRDLKPSNIRATVEGVWKITDFGVAKDLRGGQELTRTGEMPGSPSYMAPEQVTGDEITPATDVYAIGAILYECLTGRPPFLGETSAETIRQVSAEDPVPPTSFRPEIPRDLEAICFKCLEKKPHNRYEAAGELAEDLQRWLDGRTTVAQPASPLKRVAKLIRRHPVLASTLASIALAIFAISIAGWWHSLLMRQSYLREYAARQEAIASRESAEAFAIEANLERQRSEELLYWANVRQAHEAWKSDDVPTFTVTYNDLRESTSSSYPNSFPLRHLDAVANSGKISLHNTMSHVFAGRFLDESTLVTGEESGAIRVWDLENRAMVDELQEHLSCVNSFDISPNGELLASGSCDATIGVWNLSDMSLRKRLRSEHGPVGTVRFSDDGSKLYSIGLDHMVLCWNPTSGSIVEAVVPASEELSHAVVNRQASWIATASQHGRICWWRAEDHGTARIAETNSNIRLLAFHPTGSKLLATGARGQIWIWDVNDKPGEPFEVPGHCDHVAFSNDGSTVAVSCADQVIRLLDVKKIRQMGSLKCPQQRIRDLAFSQDDKMLLAVADSGSITVWRLAESHDSLSVGSEIHDVLQARLSPNSKLLALSHRDGSVSLRDIRSGDASKQLGEATQCPVTSLDFSPDGYLLSARWLNNTHRLWDISQDVPRSLVAEHRVGLIEISGKRGLRAVQNPQQLGITIETLEGNTPTARLDTLESQAFGQFDPTGTWLFVSSPRSTLLWNPGSNRQIDLDVRAKSPPDHCEYNREGTICAAAFGQQIVVYDVDDGAVKSLLRGNRGPISAITFSPDSEFLAAGGSDRIVRVWHIETGRLVLELEGHSRPVVDVRFAPDGSGLYSIGQRDHTARVLFWPAQSD